VIGRLCSAYAETGRDELPNLDNLRIRTDRKKKALFIAKIVLIVLEARLCISFFGGRREGTAFGQDFCFLPEAKSLPLRSGAGSRKSSEPVHAAAAGTGVWRLQRTLRARGRQRNEKK
jgi:hypothetical protein